jgi:thiol-disulfide isomerase/thioredoxin
MKMRVFIIFIGLALACSFAGIASPAQAPSAGAQSSERHPGFQVLDGIDKSDHASGVREIDLEGLKKLIQRDPKDTRPLLINFWATWCDQCREEFPDLVKIDADYRAKGLNFVAVSLDEIGDLKTKVEPFLKEMKATMPVVLLNVNDPEPAIHTVDPNWHGDIPATFLYDKDGKVAFKHFGRIKPDELRTAIDKLVGDKQ